MADMEIGKVAYREIGSRWVAYYTLTHDGKTTTIQLGSIQLRICRQLPKRKEEFKILMRDIAWDIIEDITGMRPTSHGETVAPESERGRPPKGLL